MDAAMTALAAAGVGRLIARDTLLREPRDQILIAIGVQRIDRMRSNDLGAECRNGIVPLEFGDHVTVEAPTPERAKLAEGISCPSCCAWWATVAIRLATDRRGFFTAAWWRDTFACWAAAAILTRIGG